MIKFLSLFPYRIFQNVIFAWKLRHKIEICTFMKIFPIFDNLTIIWMKHCLHVFALNQKTRHLWGQKHENTQILRKRPLLNSFDMIFPSLAWQCHTVSPCYLRFWYSRFWLFADSKTANNEGKLLFWAFISSIFKYQFWYLRFEILLGTKPPRIARETYTVSLCCLRSLYLRFCAMIKVW